MTDQWIESGTAPYVRVPGGFLPLEPAIKPDSILRFHRGRAPRTMPSEGNFDVASTGATRWPGLGSPRSAAADGKAPAPVRFFRRSRRPGGAMNIDAMIDQVLANMDEIGRMGLDWRDEEPDPELRRWMGAQLGAASREHLEELAFRALFDRLRDRLMEENPGSIHDSPSSPNHGRGVYRRRSE